MKIGIDARMLGHGFGLARYLEQLITHLAKIDKENEYVLFLRKDNFDHIRIAEVSESVDYKKEYFLSLPQNFRKVEADIPWYTWKEQLQLKKIFAKEKLDLVHFPHWNVPLLYNDPFVVTIHDLTMFHYPRPEATTLGPFKYFMKDRGHRLVIRHAAEKSKKIMVTSEFTKADIRKNLGIPPDKMVVTYQAPFVHPGSVAPKGHKPLFPDFHIDKPFALYVGAAYPHKNLEGLLRAWKIFEERYSEEYQLVLVGKENPFYERILHGNLRIACKNVIYTGFLTDFDLLDFYKKAALYVFPSLYEGFGLPPLEAMMHDVPVVSSDRSCLKEVLQEAALYFDPENYEAMAEAMYRGFTDTQLRANLKAKAQKLIPRYSWDTLAETTLETYKTCLS